MSTQAEPSFAYAKGRRTITLAGIAVLALIVAFEVYRGIDPVEVGATILFVPVFLAFMWKGAAGGLVVGSLATAVYLVVRLPAMQAVPEGWFIRSTIARSLAFVAFGAVGGWASRRVDSSLTKLELFDQIDDSTGLYNARYFLQEVAVEKTRFQRYGSDLSIAVMEIQSEDAVKVSRQSSTAISEYGAALKRSLRPTDRAIHAADGRGHIFAVILPDTGAEGAKIFGNRLLSAATEFFAERGSGSSEKMSVEMISFPADEGLLESFSNRLRQIDQAEHPADSLDAARSA